MSSVRLEAAANPVLASRSARLRYVMEGMAGIRRQPRGTGFVYLDPRGRVVRNPQTLGRIHSLVIPPAWQDVWICPLDNGHIQAVGRDGRGRKQYRYHPRWNQVRQETKFH